MGFTIFRTTMTILICGFLVMLFLLPSAILKAFSAQADEWIEQAENALLNGDTEAAAPYCAALRELTGKPVKESWLYALSVDKAIRVDRPADGTN